ncbi:MAG: hypothetical protein RR406_00475 [Bacilli bacterium]
MSNFKNNFKNNVISPYNKYNLTQEKLGEVIDRNKDTKTCTVSYRNIDGIKVVKSNVPVKNEKGLFKGFPKKGDYVEIQEIGKTVRILSVVDKKLASNSDTKTGDEYSSYSDFGGFIGI